MLLYDFQSHLNVDLGSFFYVGFNPKIFWAFYHGLPPSSKTKAAISQNKELAKYKADQLTEAEIAEISNSRANPGVNKDNLTPEGHGYLEELVMQVIDSVDLLRHTVTTALSKKGSVSKFERKPRPTTAYQLEVDKRVIEYERREMDELESELGF